MPLCIINITIHILQHMKDLPFPLKICLCRGNIRRFIKFSSRWEKASLIKGRLLIMTADLIPKSRLITFPYFFTNWKIFRKLEVSRLVSLCPGMAVTCVANWNYITRFLFPCEWKLGLWKCFWFFFPLLLNSDSLQEWNLSYTNSLARINRSGRYIYSVSFTG